MKIAIDVTPEELRDIRDYLGLVRLAKCLRLPTGRTVIEDKIMLRVFEAAQDESSKADSEA